MAERLESLTLNPTVLHSVGSSPGQGESFLWGGFSADLPVVLPRHV